MIRKQLPLMPKWFYNKPWAILSVLVVIVLYIVWATGVILTEQQFTMDPAVQMLVTIPASFIGLVLVVKLLKVLMIKGDKELQRVYSREATPPNNLQLCIHEPVQRRVALDLTFEFFDKGDQTYTWFANIPPEYAMMLSSQQAHPVITEMPDNTSIVLHCDDGPVHMHAVITKATGDDH